MQSSSHSSHVSHHSIRVAAEARKVIDRLATLVLMLALTAGMIIVAVWLVAWCNDLISLGGAARFPMSLTACFRTVTSSLSSSLPGQLDRAAHVRRYTAKDCGRAFPWFEK
jgi:hypothetical protein